MATYVSLINHTKKEFLISIRILTNDGFEDNSEISVYIKNSLGDTITFIPDKPSYILEKLYPGYKMFDYEQNN